MQQTLTLVLRGLAWARPWIMALTPAGPVALTAGYVATLGAIVYLGGDYVDWYRTGSARWLNLIDGVRIIVSRDLRT